MDSKEFFLDLAETFVVSLLVLLVLYGLLAFPEIVSGASMEPLLDDGDRILVEKVSKHYREFERGDVVVFHPPGDDNIDYVKRIVGIPSDVVKISDCNVFITRDGKRFMLEEPYLQEDTCTKGGTGFSEGRARKIEDETYVVLGDNRSHSADSRLFGPIDIDRIVGKAVLRFWPVSKINFL
jgi:signal peptidase I